MAPHGLYGFKMNDSSPDKITFCHNDTSLNTLGTAILKFIKRTSDKDIEAFAKSIILVKDNQLPSESELNDINETGILKKITTNMTWSEILLQEEGRFDLYSEYIKLGANCYMTDDSALLNTANLVDIAYIINLETKAIDFYKGLSKVDDGYNHYNMDDTNYRPMTKNIFVTGHFPCELVCSVTFDEIRTTLYPKMLGDRIKNAYNK